MDASVDLVVGHLRDWPDSELARAYRLVTSTVHHRQAAGGFGEDPDDLDLAADAEQLGVELIRRGLL